MKFTKLVSLTIALLSGSIGVSVGQVNFQNMSQFVGIQHMHQSSTLMGGGVAIFDFNNDGLQDIYLTGGEAQDKLLKNLGSWQFQDVSISSGIATLAPEGSFGVTTGDMDGDGFRDVLVTGDNQFPSRIFRNQGNETFGELPNALNDGEIWSTSATIGDVNGDRALDVYIGNYIKTPGLLLDGQNEVIGFDHVCFPNLLFMNNGNLTFTESSEQYGVADTGCALAVAFTDFDFDNEIELFLANDFGEWVSPSTIFENNPSQNEMIDAGVPLEMNLEMYGMGIAIGDYDRDGDLDYYQTNLGRNELSRNDGGSFADITEQANVEDDSTGQLLRTGWGTFFFDADNDAWPDLFVANGEIPAADIIANLELDSNRLFLNNGNGTFTDISETSGIGSVQRGRGAAYGDLDNDGRLDFVVCNVGEDPVSANWELYRNNSSNTGNWIAFSLRGTISNRDAFGGRVRIVVNGVSTVAEVDGGSSHASQNSSRIHFGLGSETTVDSVVVTFPSGIQEVLTEVAANQIVWVTESLTVGVSESASLLQAKILYSESGPLLFSGFTGQTVVEVFDVAGQLVSSSKLQLNQGPNKLDILESQSAGIYMVRLSVNGQSLTLKAVVSD